MLVLCLVATLIVTVKGQCDYTQYMQPGGQSYKIQSAGAYTRGSSCTWRASTDQGSNIELTCSLNIPQAGQSCLDKFYVSNTQNPNDGIIFCGRQIITQISTGNQMLVQINVDRNSPGGSFDCDIKAIRGGQNCQCGYSYKTRIVGGMETGVNEYPMMGALLSQSSKSIFCGCTIISGRYVLTAAHCMLNRPITDLAVLVGDHDVSTGRETNASYAVRVKKYTIHPQFDDAKLINDISVVELVEPLKFSPRVGPACLPIRHPESLVGEAVTILGWGSTEFGGRVATKLQKGGVFVVSGSECQQYYETKFNAQSQLCLFKRNTDACQFDSGGPVLWLDRSSNRLMIIGIISYGRLCGSQYPSVNTRVYSYLGWIETIVRDDFICVV